MAILGKIDAATFSNNVAVTNGDATVTKNAADTVVVGDVLELGNVAYIVKQVNSTTSIELHKNYAGSTNSGLSGAVRRTPPKAVAEYVVKGGDSISDYQLIFVDTTEDGIASNKSRGIDGPGWWLYRTYNTAGGTTRHKAEKLAALRVAAGTSGDDADDTVAADVLETITMVLNLLTKTHLLVQQHSPSQQLWISQVLSLISGRREHLLAVDSLTCLVQPVHLLH